MDTTLRGQGVQNVWKNVMQGKETNALSREEYPGLQHRWHYSAGQTVRPSLQALIIKSAVV